MATTGPNLYEVLGISPGASASEIKAGYRKQARKTHPDVAGAGMNGLYLMVQHAHEVLSDPARRREYDRSMDGAFSEPAEPPPSRPSGARERREESAPRRDWVAGEQVPESQYRGPLPREGHNLGKMPWIEAFDGVERSSVTIARPGLRRWQIAAIGGIAALGAFALIAVNPFVLFLLGLGVFGVALIWIFRRFPRWLTLVIGVLAALAAVVSVLDAVLEARNWGLSIAGLVGSLVLIGVMWWSAYAIRVRERQLVSQKDIAQFFSWGEPGGGLAGAEHAFGLDNTIDGIEGERLTAAEIGYFLGSIPGVRLVNGLAFPGSDSADVDHAIICGSRIALVDSKAWKPATYATVAGQDAIRVQGRDGWTYFPSHMPTAVSAFRKKLGRRHRDADIRGYVVVHPKSNGTQLRLLNDDAEGVQLVTATQLIEQLGMWFAADDQSKIVDRKLLSAMVCQVKA